MNVVTVFVDSSKPQVKEKDSFGLNYHGRRFRFSLEYRGAKLYWYVYGYVPTLGRTRSMYIGTELGDLFAHINDFLERYP